MRRPSLASLRRRFRDARGSVTIYFVSSVPAVIMLTGLVVDGGGQIRATQQANDISAETARYAAQQIDIVCATRGAEYGLEPGEARLAAQQFIEQHPEEVSLKSVSFEGNNTVRIVTAMNYEPVFLGIIGMDSREITGEAEAYSRLTSVQGKEWEHDAENAACHAF